MNFVRCLALSIAAIGLIAASPGRAAEPYEINTILSLSGNIAFVGSTQLKSLKALEAYVNQHGGINGQPISFLAVDEDQP